MNMTGQRMLTMMIQENPKNKTPAEEVLAAAEAVRGRAVSKAVKDIGEAIASAVRTAVCKKAGTDGYSKEDGKRYFLEEIAFFDPDWFRMFSKSDYRIYGVIAICTKSGKITSCAVSNEQYSYTKEEFRIFAELLQKQCGKPLPIKLYF